ncbi:MAG: methyltransferase domain-containing protein [Roseivirga sp.]|nr:methyltransferase domain-containing protein [Roseivirga sp.]
MDLLNEDYWSGRYQNGQIGWDIGYVSTPLKAYIDQLEDKSVKILIPGAGNSYEAEYLHERGFTEVFVMDLSLAPLKNLKSRVPDFPEKHLLCQDFFDHDEQYDLILEQTFFCALNPDLRSAYVSKANQLLKPTGKIAGLLFNIPLFEDHPPFGGHKNEYEALFSEFFNIEIMETAHNSIPPRAGNELFIKLLKLSV